MDVYVGRCFGFSPVYSCSFYYHWSPWFLLLLACFQQSILCVLVMIIDNFSLFWPYNGVDVFMSCLGEKRRYMLHRSIVATLPRAWQDTSLLLRASQVDAHCLTFILDIYFIYPPIVFCFGELHFHTCLIRVFRGKVGIPRYELCNDIFVCIMLLSIYEHVPNLLNLIVAPFLC